MPLVELIDQFSASNINVTDRNTQELGKDDFLKLLVMQLRYQDPLEPLKNEEFIAQLAQFNSLEQMINLNDKFEGMLTLQGMSYASSFIGREVAWYDEEGEVVAGIVQEVDLTGQTPMLNIDGALFIAPGDVIAIGQPATTT